MNYCEYLKFTSTATMSISSVNRKQYCDRDETRAVCPGGGQTGYYCPVSRYCHPENGVKCLWTNLNSVVTFSPRINQVIKMDPTH